MNTSNVYQEFHEEFLAEAREHIEKVEELLMILEKKPKGNHSEIILDIFRAIHSIKGASGFLGFKTIGDLTHLMETLLQMMRTGDIQPEPPFIDALLSGIDLLRGLLDDLATSNDADITDVYDQLFNLIHEKSSDKAKKEIQTTIQLPVPGYHDFEINEFNLNNALNTYEFIYLLKYDLHKLQKTDGLTPVLLVKNLLIQGSIVETKIDTVATSLTQDLSSVPLIYLVLYASNIPLDKIEKVSGLKMSDIVQITSKSFSPPVNPQPMIKTESPIKLSAPVPIDDFQPTEQEIYKDQSVSETIRVKVDILDRLMELAGELVLVRNQQMLFMEKSTSAVRSISQRLNIVTTELQETIMRTRMQPLGNIFSKLPRVVRDLSSKLNKKIEIILSGSDVELDKTILETLTDPLIHLIRNACDHGIESPAQRKLSKKPETGTIHVEAYHEAGQINIRIRDDGKGIDPEVIKLTAIEKGIKTKEELAHMDQKGIISLVFLPGFSTAQEVSQVSGRGVGLDVVASAVEHLGGSVEIDTNVGQGTCIHLRLPLTLAIIPCLIFTCGAHRYAIPQVNVVELVCLYDDQVYSKIEIADDQEVFRLRDQLLPMVRLAEILNRPIPFSKQTRRTIANLYHQQGLEYLKSGKASGMSLYFAVVKYGSKRFGLIVDAVIGVEEIVVKAMHPCLKSISIYSGATVMGDGRVALIMDVEGIAKHADVVFSSLNVSTDEHHRKKQDTQPVLLFKISTNEQFAVTLPLIRRIERIDTRSIENIAEKKYVTIDGTPTLILYLDEILNVSKYSETPQPFLLLPKYIKRPFGILMSTIVDIAEAPMQLNVNSYMADGLLGTAIVRGQMTLFLDIYRLIELAEPQWFAERKKFAPPPEAKKRILLVEDASFFLQLVKGYLEADQYIVITAENGSEALQLMEKTHIDLIVSDLEMPVLDGWQFLKRVREDNRWRHIPAVALTALDTEEDRLAAKEAGFDAYEIKLDREQLLTTISNIIHGKNKWKNEN